MIIIVHHVIYWLIIIVVFIVVSVLTWCQKWDCKMATICKPPDPLSFAGNTVHNWREFEEQLKWFLAGTETAEKSDLIKIGIMLSHAGVGGKSVRQADVSGGTHFPRKPCPTGQDILSVLG